MINMISRVKWALLVLTMLQTSMHAAPGIPERPLPPRLVNDFAGLLSEAENQALERKLVTYNDSTSTQVAIVTVNDLEGYDVADYAARLAEKWGIGQRGKDNGILILVKPKTGDSPGRARIETGYGLEGVIPDITCASIIDNEMIPSFRVGKYHEGLEKAADVLMSLARGDFPADMYGKPGKSKARDAAPFIVFMIILFIIMMSRGRGGKNQRHLSDKSLPLWLLLSMMSGRGSHNGSWGGFSGGGGGGFGGFGGGSFGGGGASGSW
jgi:uncharacterized protein